MAIFGYVDDFFKRRNMIYNLGLPTKNMSKLKYAYCIGMFLLALIYYCGEIVMIVQKSDKLSEITVILQMFYGLSLGFYKFYIVVFRDKDIKMIMVLLQMDEFKYKPIKNFEPYKKFNRESKVASKFCFLVMSCYIGIGASAHFSAILEIHSSSFGTINDTRTCVEIFTHSTYVPFKPTSLFGCHFYFALADFQLAIFALWISGKTTTKCIF